MESLFINFLHVIVVIYSSISTCCTVMEYIVSVETAAYFNTDSSMTRVKDEVWDETGDNYSNVK